MAGVLIAQCPSCRVKLKLSADAVRGKKIRCPKCSHVFTPRALTSKEPEIVEESFDSDDSDGFDTFENDIASVRVPVAKASRVERLPSKPKKRPSAAKTSAKEAAASERKKKSDEGINKGILIGGGVFGLCLFAALGYFAVTSLFGGRGGLLSKLVSGGNTIKLAFLPERPEVLLCVRMADLRKTQAGQIALAAPVIQKYLDKFTKNVGIPPEDVDTFTFAIAAPSALRGAKAAAAMNQLKALSGEGTKAQTRAVIVIRTLKPIDDTVLTKRLGIGFDEKNKQEPRRFDRFPLFRATEGTGCLFPNKSTLVFGTIETLKEVAANGGSPVSIPQMSTMDPKQHIILATIPENWPKAENLLRPRDEDSFSARLRAVGMTLFGEHKFAAVGLTFGDDVKIHFACQCDSEMSAGRRQKEINEDIESNNDSGPDIGSLFAGMRKNKGAEDDDQRTIKYHSNPFHIVALGDFRPASRDSKTTRHWEDINGGADLDFTATLQSEAAQTQSAEMLQRLLFFRPHFPKPRLINGLRPPGVSEEEDDPGEGIPPMAGSMHRGKNAEPGDGDDDEAPKKGEAGKPENGKTEPAEEKGPE